MITLGSKGAFWTGEGRSGFVPAVAVEAVDSTAAGDAFNGGLACALAAGESLKEAVGYASLVGAISVTRLGARTSLPTIEEVRRFSPSPSGRG